ncbi:ABC transporter ATP-binding protein [Stieleria sp. TO1_6]|uniref:ABC transporter ATP-binding protein n=1 Tax=Stieleria tagensis TaxID=2956795 RepID=UPI00209B40CE|nr:ABC transporter ATP-binding protein [Stieleria tagensis]MCO8123756.1 ABC transporter ATP-binding protein [Stieleria tagensis]
MSSLSPHAVEIRSLSRHFRGKPALTDVTLNIDHGSIFGLVGLNGAGKTTLIRHLIGSMKALHGSVNVLGQDPTIRPEKLLARIGYMSEEDSLPQWMRVNDLIQFCRSVYPGWSDRYAAELCEMFSLSPAAKLKSLSKGGRARAALLAAIAHRPELLILDEPSSGLDPIARADILEAIIRTTADEGRTVLFSSHLLDEIERVCDHVALLHDGKLLESIAADTLPDRYLQCWYKSDVPSTTPPTIPATFGPSGDGTEWSVLLDLQQSRGGPDISVESAGTRWDLIRSEPATLQRWFAGRVRTLPNRQRTTVETMEVNESV